MDGATSNQRLHKIGHSYAQMCLGSFGVVKPTDRDFQWDPLGMKPNIYSGNHTLTVTNSKATISHYFTSCLHYLPEWLKVVLVDTLLVTWEQCEMTGQETVQGLRLTSFI